ncbi:hypothetical protein M2306_000770 [Myroides gitamensis]|uniref:hypothetical protein n=1 Tax=Myroides odoratus TaxID=256 RepID=UPI002169D8FC|nr:hypothetical protein [Myroides odoratus]MCS4238000.1 hypothetical protein [Myroides odoratus]MDH6600076.1 hypothetical protein [Myroides gitamensis]
MKRIVGLTQFFIYTFIGIGYAQIGINTPKPDLSAALDIVSDNQGFLPPRIALKSTNDTETILKPAPGLLIYNTALVAKDKESVSPGYYYYTGGQWAKLADASNGWDTQGNYGIGGQNSFIGTLDDSDLVFKRNNIAVGLIGATNYALGHESLLKLTTGHNNIGIGLIALAKNKTGSFNTAVGSGALSQNLASFNTAVGSYALARTESGEGNTAVGRGSSENVDRGKYNTTMGYNAQQYGFTASYNTLIGSYAGYQNRAGVHNTALGFEALYNSSDSYNTAIGKGALYNLKPTYPNTGNLNVALGFQAGDNLISGGSNIFIGANAKAMDPTGANQLNIGNSIYGININAGNNARIGINTSEPNESAILDLSSTNRGFLPPRIELKGVDDQTTIENPAQGLLVYNPANVETQTLKAGYYYFTGQQWEVFNTGTLIKEQFYAPALVLPTMKDNLSTSSVDDIFYDVNSQFFTVKLYAIYQKQFGMVGDVDGPTRSAVKSNPTGVLTTYSMSELDYFVTYFDHTVFDPNSVKIDANGVLTYKIIPEGEISEKTYMNIVFKVK